MRRDRYAWGRGWRWTWAASSVLFLSFRGARSANPESRDSGSGPSDHPGMTAVKLLRLLAERGPERMAGINTDNAEFAREEFQFLQREGEVLVLGMAIDVGVELRGEEIAVDHVAFQLRHVDAVGGEAAHCLVERGGKVAHPENKRGDQRPRSLFGPVRLARQHHKARGVVGLVLDILGQDIEAVDISRKL